MNEEHVRRQLILAMQSLALSDRPMAQRLEGACVDLGLITEDDLPAPLRPQFREIERVFMARGRLEATIAEMSTDERRSLADKIFTLFKAALAAA